MGRLLIPGSPRRAPLHAALGLAAALAWLAAPAAPADELDVSLDLRAVSSDGTTSRLDGGLGKLRFDPDHQGLRLGYLRFGYQAEPLPTLRTTVEAVAYGDHDVNPIDLTEAYAEWRPLPRAGWRSRLKLGAFYPEVSLENRMRGWRSPYTLSDSAINTWVGEELRTIGAQYSLDWLGFALGHAWEASASIAAFGWNDPAGTVLAIRGWGFSDRADTLFGRFANGSTLMRPRTVFYDELDQRAGYHAGLDWRWRGLLELHALHYDNRADTSVAAPKIADRTWLTRFESLGARFTPSERLTLIGQWLHGRTFAWVIPGNPDDAWSFSSAFVLGSWSEGPWRYSGRYDRFSSAQTVNDFLPFPTGDDGHAWTAAVSRALGEHFTATAEWLEVTSSVRQRALLGQSADARERQLQLALRWER